MANKDDNRVWFVKCPACKTTVNLPIGDFKIISTDQGAEFIRLPRFICGKCGCLCACDLISTK